MPVMIYTAIVNSEGGLHSVEFKTDFTGLALARSFARDFPQSAKMSARSEITQSGHQYAQAVAVCELNPTRTSPGASKVGLSQYRMIMRAARKMRDLKIVYSMDNTPHAIETAAEFEQAVANAEALNRRAVRSPSAKSISVMRRMYDL